MFLETTRVLRTQSLLCAVLTLAAWAGLVIGAEAPVLPRLLATLPAEPLAALTLSDAHALPGKFAATNLAKMIRDPRYAKGLEVLAQLLQTNLGADFAALWPQIEPLLSGPVVLAVLERKAAKDDPQPPVEVVLTVLTPSAETAGQLRALWPKVPPQADNLLSILTLKTVLPDALPATPQAPSWAAAAAWQGEDLGLRMLPVQSGKVLEPWCTDHEAGPQGGWLPLVSALQDSELSLVTWGIKLDGEWFSEQVQAQFAGEASTFGRVLHALREKPGAWDALQGALPGGSDVVLLAQSDFTALNNDQALAGQALERYLRGRKWTRSKGREEAALDPRRFDFVLSRWSGAFGVAGWPALTGDLRLVTAVAVKDSEPEGLRKALLAGLGGVDALFATLPNAGSIGACAPLGAEFQGRGVFGAPLLGLSPGWIWLCSNSGAYNDLLAALKTGNTVMAETARAKAAAGAPGPWQAGDALRMELNLDKLVPIAYVAWMLSANGGPSLGSWKVPPELLPSPLVFSRRLGSLRAGLSRSGQTVNGYASGVGPGGALLLLGALREMAAGIDDARAFNRKLSTAPGGGPLPAAPSGGPPEARP